MNMKNKWSANPGSRQRPLFLHFIIGGYVRYFTVWKWVSFRKCPWAFGMRKQFKWNMVWETVLQNRHTDPLQCPSFWQHYHKTLEKNNSLVILHLASNRTQSHVYFVFWERHWSHSLRKLTSQKIEIIPSTLNLLSQDVWTTLYYFTVQKCLKVFPVSN